MIGEPSLLKSDLKRTFFWPHLYPHLPRASALRRTDAATALDGKQRNKFVSLLRFENKTENLYKL